MSIPTYHFTLPSLRKLNIASMMETAFEKNGIKTPVSTTGVLSTQFTEPSLVYRLGTGILLGKPDERLAALDMKPGDIVILDRVKKEETETYEAKLVEKLAELGLCLTSLEIVEGFNYVNGDPVKLDILQTVTCPTPTIIIPTRDSEETATKPDP